MPRYTRADYERMIDLYQVERSLMRAASRFGCSHNTIRAALRRAGVSVRPTGGRRRPPGSAPTWFRRNATNGYAVWYGWIPGENRYATLSEHRLLLEQALGRALTSGEEVHHRNGVRDDNRLENLELRRRPHGSGSTHCPHCGKELFVVPGPKR